MICILNMIKRLQKYALRKGLWFKVLNIHERLICKLVQRNIKRVRNKILAITLARIIVKLCVGLQNNRYIKRLEKSGKDIVNNISKMAVNMGWIDAAKWIYDSSIIRWYGLILHEWMIIK